MLVKVGRFYLTLGTFIYNAEMMTIHSGNQVIQLEGHEATTLQSIFCDVIAAQQTIQQQVEAVNKQQAELQVKAQEIAQYEQQLMQKAAQVDAAYAAMQQNKSPVILPPSFGKIRK